MPLVLLVLLLEDVELEELPEELLLVELPEEPLLLGGGVVPPGPSSA